MNQREIDATREHLNHLSIGLRLSAALGKMIVIAVINSIHLYQHTLSLLFGPSCRFYPSCSAYAIDAFQHFGFMKGAWLTLKRLTKCHPFHPGGYDPVPVHYRHCEMETIPGKDATEK